jgi:transposase
VIGPTGAVKVLVATKPVDFRKGAEGLAALVREQIGAWRGLRLPCQAQ